MSEHTPTPWQWVIHDSSMATIEGPREMWDHVLSISPCKHCQGENWKWGACTVPGEADADFIVKAANNHDALVKALTDALCELSACAEQMGCRRGGSVHRAQEAARLTLSAVGPLQHPSEGK